MARQLGPKKSAAAIQREKQARAEATRQKNIQRTNEANKAKRAAAAAANPKPEKPVVESRPKMNPVEAAQVRIQNRDKKIAERVTNLANTPPSKKRIWELTGDNPYKTDLTPERYPNAISYNPSHSVGLRDIASEFNSRLQLDVSNRKTKSGKLKSTARPTLAIQRALEKPVASVNNAIQESFNAHKAGDYAHALAWYTKACNELKTSLTTVANSKRRVILKASQGQGAVGGRFEEDPRLTEAHAKIDSLHTAYKQHLRDSNGGKEVPGVTDSNRPEFNLAEVKPLPIPNVAKPNKPNPTRGLKLGKNEGDKTLFSYTHEINQETTDKMRKAVKPHWTKLNPKGPNETPEQHQARFEQSEAHADPRKWALNNPEWTQNEDKDPFPHNYAAQRLGLSTVGQLESVANLRAKKEEELKAKGTYSPEKINAFEEHAESLKAAVTAGKQQYNKTPSTSAFPEYEPPKRPEAASAEALSAQHATDLMSGHAVKFIAPPEPVKAPTGRASTFHETVQTHSEGGEK